MPCGPVRLQGWPRRRRTLVLEAERSCSIPELVLVRRPGAVLPLRPDQGTVVVRVPAQQVDQSTPLEIPFEIESREPARLRLFSSQERAGVMLHDPPVDQLTVP